MRELKSQSVILHRPEASAKGIVNLAISSRLSKSQV